MNTRIFLLVAALMISFVIFAQNKITINVVDGNNSTLHTLDVPLKQSETVQINLAGDMNATALLSELESGLDNAGINVGGAVPTYTCTNGSCDAVSTASTTITTTINEDAEVCIEYFDNAIVNTQGALSANSTFTYTTSSGGKYRVVCEDNLGLNVASSVQINLTAPPVISISNSTSVASGSDLDIIWSVSNSPDTCTFTGDWPNGDQTNVSPTFYTSPITLTNITTMKSLTLACTNSAGTGSSQTVNITISGSTGSVWPGCAGQAAPILNGVEDRTIIANTSANAVEYDGTWADIRNIITDGDWPGTSNNVLLSITTNTYMAARFNSGDVNLRGQVTLTPPTAIEGPSSNGIKMSISECPGDFNVHNNQTRCITSGTLKWATDPSQNPLSYCMLDKNKVYYYNIVFSSGTDNYSTSDCESGLGYCGIIITNATF